MAMTDKELVKRCQTDPAAFQELMSRYAGPVFAYARTSTHSVQDAEEVTQDVFVKIYRAAHRFDSHYSFKTWMYTIVSNTCKNKLRARKEPTVSLDNEDTPPVAVSHEASPLDAYKRKIEIAEVRNAINELPPRYKQVLYLRYVEGLRYKEIAEVLDLSLGNVEARIFRGKEKVRRMLLKKAARNKRDRGTGTGDE